MRSSPVRRGVTLPELLVVLGIVLLLFALAAPAIFSTRESARAVQCLDRLRGLALLTMNYESQHGHFPYTSTAWVRVQQNGPEELQKSVSPHFELMKILDPAAAQTWDPNDLLFISMNPDERSIPSLEINRQLLLRNTPEFLCPSDHGGPGDVNYRANMGPNIAVMEPQTWWPTFNEFEPTLGAFVNGRSVQAKEFTDGLSQTALYSERVIGDRQTDRYDPFRDIFSNPGPHGLGTDFYVAACRDNAIANPVKHYSFLGTNWILGDFAHTWYQHSGPPNSTTPDCASGESRFSGADSGLYTARSFHAGYVNVAFADGAARKIEQSIDLRLWKAMSTRAGTEAGID